MILLGQTPKVMITFSGRVSTLKRMRPTQSTRTMAKEVHSTSIGFLATRVPYILLT